jgi:CheY-like chemotaxis protein
MDRAVLERIFEPFFTTKDVGRGTGLGLATVFGIVKQSGGHIGVRSELGVGTTFEILFPEASASASVAPRARRRDGELQRGAGETVLVVEDDPAVFSLVRAVLADSGYVVLAAGSPDDALRLVDGHPHPIHLLLTDVVMPRMNGPELARRVRARRPDTKVLFMSGYSDEGVLEADAALLQKPITPGALLRRLREVLDD